MRPSPEDNDPLAVGGHYIFLVGGHPVEAATAYRLVPRRTVLDDVYHVVARPPREVVLGQFAPAVVGHKVVTCPALHVVGTFAVPNEIVAGPTKKVLVPREEADCFKGFSSSAQEAILTRPAQQIVAAIPSEERVVAAVAYEVVVPV